MLWGKPVVNIDSNSPKLRKVPAQNGLVIKIAKGEASAMIDNKYRTSIFRKYLRFVDSNCYGTSVSDWNLSVVFHVGYFCGPNSTCSCLMPFPRKNSCTQFWDIDVRVQWRDGRRVL